MNKAYMSSLRLIYIKRIAYTVAQGKRIRKYRANQEVSKIKEKPSERRKKVRYY